MGAHTRASLAVQQNACSVHFEHNAVDLQDFVTPLPVEGDGGSNPGQGSRVCIQREREMTSQSGKGWRGSRGRG